MQLSRVLIIFVLAFAAISSVQDAQAYRNIHIRHHRDVSFGARDAAIVVDADTGKVIMTSKADEIRHPASLTKMMTLYLTFEALEAKRIHLTDRMPVSYFAAHQAPTNLDMIQGDTLTVEQAIKALVVRSANDAAVVLAEYMGGTESGFARMMSGKARALGMMQTHYNNASGLPDPRQITTARDLAVLGMALRQHFGQYYHYFNTREFTLNGINYTTHNHVLERYQWADGLKTGYVRMSGFNLVTSAKKDGHSLVGVVLGGNSFRERDDRMIALLDDAFDQMNNQAGELKSVSALVKVPGVKTVRVARAETEKPEDAAAVAAVSNEGTDEATIAQGDTESTEVHRDWGVQVGLFGASKDAMNAALQAQKLASQELGNAHVKIFSNQEGHVALHRARIENISQEQAQNACRRLMLQRESCFAYHVGAL